MCLIREASDGKFRTVKIQYKETKLTHTSYMNFVYTSSSASLMQNVVSLINLLIMQHRFYKIQQHQKFLRRSISTSSFFDNKRRLGVEIILGLSQQRTPPEAAVSDRARPHFRP